MGNRLRHLLVVGLIASVHPAAEAGKWGFADKPGGGKHDPVIKVFGSIAPNTGALMSMTEKQANDLYTFNSGSGFFDVLTPPPVIPPNGSGANQFIILKFPMKISGKRVQKSLFKNDGLLSGQSFLTSNLQITDETGTHVPGIATIKGRNAQKVKVSNDPNFPFWATGNGKNRLLDKKSFTYIADDGDQDIATTAAFGDSGIQEVRIRLRAIGGVTVNGFWVLKIGDGAGMPADGGGTLLMNPTTATLPVTPPKMSNNGDPIVEAFSKYIVEYTEPIIPESAGFNATMVRDFNATNPVIPLLYNGNTAMVPNPENLQVPYYPNFATTASPNNGASSPFVVPFDARPINPNNFSQMVMDPLIDLPNKIDLTLTGIAFSNNNNFTSLPGNPGIQTAATTFWNARFDDTSAAASSTFRIRGGRAFTNLPVSPQALYYAPLSGTGMGVVNLDGNGFETNDPSTSRLLLLTNSTQVLTCPFGSYLFGCNKNTYGDVTGVNPIGLGGNPAALGGPTPIPGVNEGSTGSTAGGGNPNAIFPQGFETVARNSEGEARILSSPALGSVGDIQIGDYLDKLFFDTLNPNASVALHTSFALGGGVYQGNNISDPPVPNPPPNRLAVGLTPVDMVFNQQRLKQPPFVIENDEVFTFNPLVLCGPGSPCYPAARILLLPNPINPLAGDVFPTFAQNGPAYQSFTPPTFYAARQQIGNYMYVTDRDNGVVQCLNSNNFSVLAQIETPDPEGLGLAPDLKTLYVSNLGDDSVSLIGTDPYSPFFHKEISRVRVGSSPRDVAVQPEGEDVFVCNYGGNSVSIIDPTSQTVRRTLTAGLSRPWEIVLSPRHFFTGWLSANYQGYILNQGTGDIVIYESGPSGVTGVGADEVRWSARLDPGLAEMRHVTWDPATYPGAASFLPGGIFATHRDVDTGLAMVSRVVWTAQQPAVGAFPPVPLPWTVLNAPASVDRIFEIVGSYGGPLVQLSQQLNFGGQDQVPYDAAMIDFQAGAFFANVTPFVRTNLGGLASTPALGNGAGFENSKNPLRFTTAVVPAFSPDRLYVSFPGDNRIEVLDPNVAGLKIGTITGVPVPGRLATYFDQ